MRKIFEISPKITNFRNPADDFRGLEVDIRRLINSEKAVAFFHGLDADKIDKEELLDFGFAAGEKVYIECDESFAGKMKELSRAATVREKEEFPPTMRKPDNGGVKTKPPSPAR